MSLIDREYMNRDRPHKSSHHAKEHHDQDRYPDVSRILAEVGKPAKPIPPTKIGRVRAKITSSPWFYLILVGCAGIAYLLLV